MRKKLSYVFIFFFLSLLPGCHSGDTAVSSADETPQPITPVTVTHIKSGPMKEEVALNATSSFQQKWIIKANVTGYLQNTNLQLNGFVGTGQLLFTLKTKEAQSIGNTINDLDPNFKFSGVNHIYSKGNGFISEINHQSGDYVQDGEQLAVITDSKSLVFLLDLPYELKPLINSKDSIQLLLPDGEKLSAIAIGRMALMDSAAQTQRISLKTNATHPLPENLIAKVNLVKRKSDDAALLPKTAILTDETQSIFWVMKIVHDSIALKVPVKKGIETNDEVQIISPVFGNDDKIIISGNFGLQDSARVKIANPGKIKE